MKKLILTTSFLAVLSCPAYAGLKAVSVIPGGGGAPNVSNATGTLPVANGGTGLSTLTSNAIYKGNGTGAMALSSLTDSGTVLYTTDKLGVGTSAPAQLLSVGSASQFTADLNGNVVVQNPAAATSGTSAVSPSLTLSGVFYNSSNNPASMNSGPVIQYTPPTNIGGSFPSNFGFLKFTIPYENTLSTQHVVQFISGNQALAVINTNDNLGGFVNETYSTAYFGLENTSTSAANGVVPANGFYGFFAIQNTGKLGSVVPGTPSGQAFRNVLDDGTGKMGVGTSLPAYPLDVVGAARASGLIAGGSSFTASGCSVGTLKGGATAGSMLSGTSGTCTIVLSGFPTSPNGWACAARDESTGAAMNTTADTTTGCTISGTTTSGDKITFSATGY